MGPEREERERAWLFGVLHEEGEGLVHVQSPLPFLADYSAVLLWHCWRGTWLERRAANSHRGTATSKVIMGHQLPAGQTKHSPHAERQHIRGKTRLHYPERVIFLPGASNRTRDEYDTDTTHTLVDGTSPLQKQGGH